MRILKFETSHCPMCHALDISLNKLHIEVEHIDAEQDPETAARYGVQSVPKLIKLDDAGNVVDKCGYVGMLELREFAK